MDHIKGGKSMKSSLLKKLGVGLTVTVFCGTSALMAMVNNSIITGSGTVKTETLSEGVIYRQELGAKTGAYSQNIYTVTYDYTDPKYDLVMGGKVGERDTVSEMAKMLNAQEGYTVLAGVNGDHFSFRQAFPWASAWTTAKSWKVPRIPRMRRDICFIPSVSPGTGSGDRIQPHPDRHLSEGGVLH